MVELSANSVLPARREEIVLTTADGLHLVGELALPLDRDPVATLIMVHPNPTGGGMMDSHVYRKAAWRLPALADLAILRFNTRGTASAAGRSEGEYDEGRGEGLDLAAAIEFAKARSLPNLWLVGWSFGTDVVIEHGNVPDIEGAVLLSPPLRWSSPAALQSWTGRVLVALVPELDDYLRPAQAKVRFADAAQVLDFPGAVHLWVGEKQVRQVLDALLGVVRPELPRLTWTWDGPMQKWDDLKGGLA